MFSTRRVEGSLASLRTWSSLATLPRSPAVEMVVTGKTQGVLF
jgi:hypothetical protein